MKFFNLKDVSFRYKLFIPFVVILIVGVLFYSKFNKVSSTIQTELIQINNQNLSLRKKIDKLSKDIIVIQSNILMNTLEEKMNEKIYTKVNLDINTLLLLLNDIKKNPLLLSNEKIQHDLTTMEKRLNSYFKILLSFPDDYKEDKIDAFYSILALSKINLKIKQDLTTLKNNSNKMLSDKINYIYSTTAKFKKDFAMSMSLALIFIFLINYLIRYEILSSIKYLEDVNRTFQDFLNKKTSKVIEINKFQKDEIGDILKIVNENIVKAEKIIENERVLTREIEKINTSLVGQLQKSIKDIKELNRELEATQKEVIYTMGAIGESRSKETGNHVKRVAEYSALLAELYGLPKEEVELIKVASPMHDIGKVAIPDSILKKPGKLTDEEFEVMKTHASLGYEMLKHSSKPIFKTAAIIAYEHHEKYNGKGYPRGLKGDEIHIYGAITAVADVFDALGSDRVYKKAWELDRILNLLKEERGEHFHPKLVDLFLENIDKFIEIRDRFKDEDTQEGFMQLHQKSKQLEVV